MFFILLLSTFAISLLVSYIVVKLFHKPTQKILSELSNQEMGDAWAKYLMFATYVTGVSGGVRPWAFEQYLNPDTRAKLVTYGNERLALEIYKTVIGSLQSIIFVGVVFFFGSLIAYSITKRFQK